MGYDERERGSSGIVIAIVAALGLGVLGLGLVGMLFFVGLRSQSVQMDAMAAHERALADSKVAFRQADVAAQMVVESASPSVASTPSDVTLDREKIELALDAAGAVHRAGRRLDEASWTELLADAGRRRAEIVLEVPADVPASRLAPVVNAVQARALRLQIVVGSGPAPVGAEAPAP